MVAVWFMHLLRHQFFFDTLRSCPQIAPWKKRARSASKSGSYETDFKEILHASRRNRKNLPKIRISEKFSIRLEIKDVKSNQMRQDTHKKKQRRNNEICAYLLEELIAIEATSKAGWDLVGTIVNKTPKVYDASGQCKDYQNPIWVVNGPPMSLVIMDHLTRDR